MASSTSAKLALDKLSDSGLTLEDFKALHMDVLDGAETAAIGITKHAHPTLVINYMDPWHPGKPLSPYPKHPPFRRYRFLGDPLPKDVKGKPIRYIQPPKSGCCAYFPTTVDWVEVKDDHEFDLGITEGEIKASAACKAGLRCIGLGGVSNFSNTKMGFEFVPELEAINWVQRKVYLVFDNDGKPKLNVVDALNRLGALLVERGAIVYTVFLDPVPGKDKTGIDDFLVHFGPQALYKNIMEAELLLLAKPLWEMNDTHAVIMHPAMILNKTNGRVYRPSDFINVTHADLLVPEQKMMPDGTMSTKRVPLPKHWMQWRMRSRFEEVTYAPGQPRELEDGRWNAWDGWGSEPVKGDVTPLLQLLEVIFGTTKEGKEAQRWFLQWCAYPIQHPGAKLYTSVLLWSREHGVGKTLMGYVLGRIYGRKNWIEVKQKDLHGDFNSWAKGKQFIIGDEITGSDSHEVADQLKNLITSDTILINEKFVPQYELPNVANFFLTSNRASALYLEDDDRRFFVWQVRSKASDEFYAMFDKWYKTHENIQAVHHYLMTLDLAVFNPLARAMSTEDKLAMTEGARASHAAWCHELRDTPDFYLRRGRMVLEADLYSADELLALFKDKEPFTQVKTNTLGSALKAAGFSQLPLMRWGSPERRDRFFIVRNEEKWSKAPLAQIRKHLESTKPQTSPTTAQHTR
jgi:hypothetical protein